MLTPAQEEAVAELSRKTLRQIQVETAFKWAYRAWAARAIAREVISRVAPFSVNGDAAPIASATLEHDATEYEHEAIEHAALSESDEVLADVRAIIRTGEPIYASDR